MRDFMRFLRQRLAVHGSELLPGIHLDLMHWHRVIHTGGGIFAAYASKCMPAVFAAFSSKVIVRVQFAR